MNWPGARSWTALQPGVPLRRPLPLTSWAGRPTCWRQSLSYPAVKACPGDGGRPVGHGGVLPRGGQIPPGTATGTAACACPPGRPRPWTNLCPVCGKPLTIGVEHRVEDSARRQPGEGPAGAKPFVQLAPLATVLAARLGKGEQTKTVQGVYEALLAQLGPEFTVLRQTPAEGHRRPGRGGCRPGGGAAAPGESSLAARLRRGVRQALLPRGVKAKKEGAAGWQPLPGRKNEVYQKVRSQHRRDEICSLI